MLTDPFYCNDYAPTGRRQYVSKHSRGPFYLNDLIPLEGRRRQDGIDQVPVGVCEDYIKYELEQRRRAERLSYYHREINRDRDRNRDVLMERFRMAEIQERGRLLEEERRVAAAVAAAAAAAAERRERRLQMLIHEESQEKEASRRRHMLKSQPSSRIRHDPEMLFFNPMTTIKDPICEGMRAHTTKKEMPYQFTNNLSCQAMSMPMSMPMSLAPKTRCDTKTPTSIHAKAVTQEKNHIVSIREPLSLPVQVEDASDSECEDEFSDYIRNRRPKDGEWIEPVEVFQRL